MKKTLEAVLIVAALAIGVFLLRLWRVQADLAAHRPVASPSARPGTDREGSPQAAGGAPHAGSVSALPMIKLTRTPKPLHRASAVPAPASTP